MEATLTSPSCKTCLCEIVDLPDALYDIKFAPQEEGIHIVSLKHKGLHIAGNMPNMITLPEMRTNRFQLIVCVNTSVFMLYIFYF